MSEDPWCSAVPLVLHILLFRVLAFPGFIVSHLGKVKYWHMAMLEFS